MCYASDPECLLRQVLSHCRADVPGAPISNIPHHPPGRVVCDCQIPYIE